MKQTFFTGDLPVKVIVIDSQFTDEHKKVLTFAEIAKMKANPNDTVFWRRYNHFCEAKS